MTLHPRSEDDKNASAASGRPTFCRCHRAISGEILWYSGVVIAVLTGSVLCQEFYIMVNQLGPDIVIA